MEKDKWDKIGVVGTLLSSIALPVVALIFTITVQRANDDSDKRTAELQLMATYLELLTKGNEEVSTKARSVVAELSERLKIEVVKAEGGSDIKSTYAAHLTWSPSYTRSDGSKLEMEDIAGYLVQVSGADKKYQTTEVFNAETKMVIKNLSKGQYIFSVKTVDKNGIVGQPAIAVVDVG